MIKIIKMLQKLTLVFTLALLFMPGVVHAKFEPSLIIIEGASTGTIPQKVPAGNLDAVITPTASDTTGYVLQKYVYEWNNDNEAPGLGSGSASVPHGDPIVISTNALAQFGASDEDKWYLHVKTVYFSTGAGIAYSDLVTVGPYTFDNVAPSAAISLDTSVDGQTNTTAKASPIILEVIGELADINKVYVNTSEVFGTADAYDFSDLATSTLSYEVAGTGSKTIYAWFEDATGNRSDATSLTFTILAGKSMDPADPFTLGIGNSRTFEILGADVETYTWSIVDATSLGASSAASVAAGTSTSTAVVTGVSEGTIRVEAKTSGADPIYSGVITVQQMGYTITHSYKAGLNLVPFSLTGTGITNASGLRNAIETANPSVSVSQIFGWDAINQRYATAFVVLGGSGYFDFSLVEGAAYFVQTDGTGTLALSGTDFSSISVSMGLNLLSAPYSKLSTLVTAADFDLELSNSTSLAVSQIFGWDTTNQRYATAYVVLGGSGYFDFNLAIGAQGYFVQLSGEGTYTP